MARGLRLALATACAAALFMLAPSARAECTMPPGAILRYAGPGSHTNENICDFNPATGKYDACNLSGWLYAPPPQSDVPYGSFPAIVFIHGSGRFKNMADFCTMLNYFTDNGYVVWVPYLRGYDDNTKNIAGYVTGLPSPTGSCTDPTGKQKAGNFCNSGIYISDATSSASSTFRVMRNEVDHEIAWAIDYLIHIPSLIGDNGAINYAHLVDAQRIALAGHSFGGATVMEAADSDLQPLPAAIIDMSGGVLSWPDLDDQDPPPCHCKTEWKSELSDKAQARKMPIYMFQTLNESSLFYLGERRNAVGSTQVPFEKAQLAPSASGDTLMSVFSAVPASKVDALAAPWCSSADSQNQCAHKVFVKDPDEVMRWAPHVLEFLQQRGL